MLTKQEQEILDNAPDGATHYMKHDIHGIEYAVESESGSAYIDASNTSKWFLLCEWKAISLSDLRKKQGKTVVDAVNYFKGVDSSHGWTHIITPAKTNKTHEQGIMEFDVCNEDNKYWDNVCTTEEFNQCVKDMAEARWMNKGGGFFCYESYKEDYQEPVKPRVRVKYVPCNFTSFINALNSMVKDGGKYYVGEGSRRSDYRPESDNFMDDVCMKSLMEEYSFLYREVETEIKTEKRWVIVTDIAYKELYTSIEDAEAYAFHMGLKPQYIEITVEV